MSSRQSPLHDLRVASPCSASWERMEGDERVRFCDHCALHVYNLSALTASEAESLVMKKEGRLCVRFYQREDGTVMTEDCPRGLAAMRRAARRTTLLIGGSFAAMLLLIFGLLGIAIGMGDHGGRGSINKVQPFKTIDSWLNGSTPACGAPAPGSVIMGKIGGAMPPPASPVEPPPEQR